MGEIERCDSPGSGASRERIVPEAMRLTLLRTSGSCHGELDDWRDRRLRFAHQQAATALRIKPKVNRLTLQAWSGKRELRRKQVSRLRFARRQVATNEWTCPR